MPSGMFDEYGYVQLRFKKINQRRYLQIIFNLKYLKLKNDKLTFFNCMILNERIQQF